MRKKTNENLKQKKIYYENKDMTKCRKKAEK